MKKICFILAITLILTAFPIYGYNRLFYLGKVEGKDDWYIDTQSIQHNSKKHTVRFWCINVFTTSHSKRKAKKERKKGSKATSQIKYYLEIDFYNNTYLLIEKHDFDKDGHIVNSLKVKQPIWNNIVPLSVVETMREALIIILQDNKYSAKHLLLSTLTTLKHENIRNVIKENGYVG